MEGVNPLRSLYDWVLRWAETPYGTWALFLVAFFESSVFPVPPDLLLMALSLSIPARSFYYALICSSGSVLGGIGGYLIGLFLFETLGVAILNLYGITDKYAYVQELYRTYDVWVVGLAGFTPIPYKVFTIAAGVFQIDFTAFVAASIVSRSARFFLLALLMYLYGGPIRRFLERYFNLITIAIAAALIGGFAILRGW